MAEATQTTQRPNARVDVSRALTQIMRHGRTLEWIRGNRSQWLATALHQELLFGTLRHYLSLQALVGSHLKKPLKPRDLDIMHVILVGAYQLNYTQIAEHAAINECVTASKALGKAWAKGLINAVLRSIQRQSLSESAQVSDPRGEHPDWMADLLTNQYGDDATQLMAANNQRAPMTLRINPCVISTADYKGQLKAAAINFTEGPWPEALTLEQPQPAADLPGWHGGACAVQDLGAQCASQIMMQLLTDHATGDGALRLLDACAAPGGKLFHLKERLTVAGIAHRLYALDNKANRLADLARIGRRLGHRTEEYHDQHSEDTNHQDDGQEDSVTLSCADAGQSPLPFNEAFDAILIDAPCTGSGTIRRNPDIRLLLSPQALLQQPPQQQRLLQNLWQHVKPGGTLVYSTCSVFAEENDQVIQSFLVKNKDAHVVPLHLSLGHPTRHGLQLLPTNPLTDGFFYCALSKAPSTVSVS